MEALVTTRAKNEVQLVTSWFNLVESEQPKNLVRESTPCNDVDLNEMIFVETTLTLVDNTEKQIYGRRILGRNEFQRGENTRIQNAKGVLFLFLFFLSSSPFYKDSYPIYREDKTWMKLQAGHLGLELSHLSHI